MGIQTYIPSRPSRFAIGAVVLGLFLIVSTAGAAAAPSTSVSVTPENESVEVGETTTFDIRVDSVDDGVTTFEFDAELNDSSVAEITNVSLDSGTASSPANDISYSEDGSSVSVASGSGGHTNGTIASVTVKTTGTGTAELGLNNVVLSNSSFTSYEIDSRNNATITAESPSVDMETRPETRTVATDGNATVDVLITGADNGVGTYEFNASVNDTTAATITNVSLVGTDASAPSTQVDVSDDGSHVSVASADGSTAGARVATIRIRGHSVGAATLSIEDPVVGDSNSTSYQVSTTGTTQIDVRSPPQPVSGDQQPDDLDDDGTYEDVNGDGDLNIIDVGSLLRNSNSDAIEESEAFYDYNGDGRFNIIDIGHLLGETI